MHVIAVLNERAGSLAAAQDAASPEALRAALQAAGATATVQRATVGGVESALRAAVAARPDAIFVGGGDGTVSTAASFLADTGIPLGVLPLGTLNHFAKDLGIPADWREAVSALARAPRVAVDLGEVNSRIFINNCSLGAYAEAVRRRDALRRERGHRKWTAMLLASCAVFRELRRLRVTIEAPGRRLALRTPFVLVANNRYSGHVLGPSLRPDLRGGRLWLYTTAVHRHGAVLRMFWQSLRRGRIDAADALAALPMEAATIAVERGTPPLAIDGELAALRPPFAFRIRPGALTVLAPPSTT